MQQMVQSIVLYGNTKAAIFKITCPNLMLLKSVSADAGTPTNHTDMTNKKNHNTQIHHSVHTTVELLGCQIITPLT